MRHMAVSPGENTDLLKTALIVQGVVSEPHSFILRSTYLFMVRLCTRFSGRMGWKTMIGMRCSELDSLLYVSPPKLPYKALSE